MSRINMKGATPHRWKSLCDTCSYAHIVTGFRESELAVICKGVYPNFAVPYKVQDCTSYLDRNRPDYNVMTRLAIDVEPASSLKPVGFRAEVTVMDEDEVEELKR